MFLGTIDYTHTSTPYTFKLSWTKLQNNITHQLVLVSDQQELEGQS